MTEKDIHKLLSFEEIGAATKAMRVSRRAGVNGRLARNIGRGYLNL